MLGRRASWRYAGWGDVHEAMRELQPQLRADCFLSERGQWDEVAVSTSALECCAYSRAYVVWRSVDGSEKQVESIAPSPNLLLFVKRRRLRKRAAIKRCQLEGAQSSVTSLPCAIVIAVYKPRRAICDDAHLLLASSRVDRGATTRRRGS